MKILTFICLFALSFSLQNTYSPAMNVNLKGILIHQIQEVIVPEIMKKFSEIDIPDVELIENHYEAKIFGGHASVVPLTKDQLSIKMNPE